MINRINLIYPPASLPTSPYSSLPYLKGGLELLGVDVKCFDLNVEAFNYWLSESFAGSYNPEVENAKNYLKQDAKSILEKKSYSHAKTIITSFFESLNKKLKDRSLSFGGYLFPNFEFSFENIVKLSKDLKDPISNFYYHNLQKVNFISEYFGISITYDFQLIPSLLLSYFIKKKYPESKIIIGGASILYLKSFFLKHKWIFKLIDLIIIGDGVYPLYNFLNRGKIVENCIFLNSNSSSIYYNYTSEKIDINNMASPDYSCLPIEKYFSPLPTGIIFTSLGCYYGKCAFCIPSKGKNFKYQLRSLEKLKTDIIKTKQALNSDLIFFGDDSININYLKKLFTVLNDKIYWQGEFRLEKNLSKNTLAYFSKHGCLQMLFGLESANQRISNKMRKGINIEDIPNILKNCVKANIRINIQNIIGFPTETIEEAYETASFLYKMRDNINSCAISSFTLYQGSDIYNNPNSYGVKILKDSFTCDYKVSTGLNQVQSKIFSTAIFKSISDYLPANNFFLDGPMGNHAMIYYKHNIKL